MDEKARFAVGIDLGTSNVRAVMGRVNSDGTVHIVGYGQAPSEGLRRGSVKELNSPVKAIDMCLRQVEELSGIEVHEASVSINGVSVGGTKIDGMIAVGVADHEINDDDIERLENAAIAGKVPANRKVLDLVPYEYILDGQGNISEPYGMKGARLEIRANVVSALISDYENLQKVCEAAQIATVNRTLPSVVAAANAVLTNKQKENGVAVVDLGATTTGVAVYEEGELQYLGVSPIGSNDVTKDLATVLMTIPEVAEELKLRYVTGKFEEGKDIVITRGKEKFEFSREQVNEVAEARLEEIFEAVTAQLKAAHCDRLSEGIVLVGGGSRMRDIDVFAREQLKKAVRIGLPREVTSVSEEMLNPEFAAAIGLMLADDDVNTYAPSDGDSKFGKKKKDGGGIFGFLKGIGKKFK